MTEKFTIREIKTALETRQAKYKELGKALAEEANLARAESLSARSILEGKLAAFVAGQLPALDAPALKTFQHIAVEHNHPQQPGHIPAVQQAKNANSLREQAEIEATHGPRETLQQQLQQLNSNLTVARDKRDGAQAQLRTADHTLRPLDKLNRKLEELGAPGITPQTLPMYDKPEGFMAHAWRHMTDRPYREARPVLERYKDEHEDLAALMTGRESLKAAQAAAELAIQTLQPDKARATQTLQKLDGLKAVYKTDREILNDVRVAVTGMILSDPAIFNAVDKTFPGALDAGDRNMHTRMQLFGQMTTTIGMQKTDMNGVADSLDKPLTDMAKAIRNGNGSRRVEFDLSGKAARLDKHQMVMAQRVQASRDIRSASHTSTATYSPDNSTNWLLWYLILSDNNHATSTPAAHFNSGMGGDFGGGGASGGWTPEAGHADNSFFRAELLGVTPHTASQFGIDSKDLGIPADFARDLGFTSQTSTDFNSLGSQMDTSSLSDFRKDIGTSSQGIDLGSFSSDLSSLSSDLGSTSSSDWGSSSGSSYDSGSSWSSSDSGSSYSSYDSGSSSYDSGSSSCSFD